jgi:uncharacterized protein YjbI with pentapeptide repeats
MYNADLTGAVLDRAVLTGAGLRWANLTAASLFEANLTGSGLDGLDLTNTVGLSQGQVDVAVGDARTRLPAGLTWPASWPPQARPTG